MTLKEPPHTWPNALNSPEIKNKSCHSVQPLTDMLIEVEKDVFLEHHFKKLGQEF